MVVPSYPRLARMARVQGKVSVQIEIGSDGRVVWARASGAHPLLLREAEEDTRAWVFSAPCLGGRLPQRRVVVFVYELHGREEYYDQPATIVLRLPDRVEITAHPPQPQPSGK